ncbi:MAG: DNA-directed RNA polymerase subunit H [Candidatus Heimdallarchaeota archaeon]|nr:DNA-directed RNA polymerase subunit H [Candidatus Heimdallarchaeota archaeon]
MVSLKIDEGWIVAVKRFTYTADREAAEGNIKLLKKNHPIFNIYSHRLVPEHQLMSKEEIKEMLKSYNAKLKHLPRIYEDDHGVLVLGAKPGDVVRIIRNKDSYAYRIVVSRIE